MPLILPSNSISAVGYEVDNSLRFDAGSNDSLSRTLGSGNQKTFTISFWFKPTKFSFTDSGGGVDSEIIGQTASSYFRVILYRDARVQIYGPTSFNFITTRLFRDFSAWYHIVVAVDTTQATEANRVKIYINGVQETNFSTETYPSQNQDIAFNNAQLHSIGRSTAFGGYDYLDAYLSEVVLIDGTALDPTSFGEFDSATGIWKPIDVSGLTFGTNGFYLPFENSGALGQDDSGNGNNFTVNNLTSIDQTTDTPTNNFATANGIMGNLTATFSNGNLTVASTGGGNFGGASTLGLTQGKWYAEFKITAQTADCGHLGIDGDPQESARNDHFAGENAWSYGYNASGTKINNNSSSSYGDTFTLNDIIMVAMDLDNNYVYFGKNGTWQNSGDPTSGASGTGSAFSISSSPPSGAYFFVSGDGSGSNSATIAHNYGNPPFTISSGNSDANGYGNFEYSVPSGYYALNTKNLAEFG